MKKDLSRQFTMFFNHKNKYVKIVSYKAIARKDEN